ncbi:restriction endonuclease subunit S [Pseudomonas simiae]|uniref:restriction endonuclease subunit S n=1 Tax=Pseudomonas simiae TaxID=321846 RepID=UPI001966DB31|nr:restriction endonuclease subunit S [Pseudomonas simiae]QQD30264.2 restriction endonuclease subunit S [Pseudomonas simiae]
MWRNSLLGDLVEITSGGTPSRDISEYWQGDIPWVTPTDVTACRTNYLFATADRITKKGLLNSSAKVLPAGSILFTSRATVGVSKIASVPVCTNQGFKSLTPLPGIDGVFLFYQVQRLRGEFERFAAGSTFPEINKKDTARVLIPHPEDPWAQKKIAAILTAIDATIQKTEAVIAKYQQIKAGLMHDVFTRGVLANGQLRPSREQAPELYQETKIGWIPREWDLKRCADLCKRICVGIVIQPTQYYVDEGVPALRSANVREDGIDPINFVYISAASNQLLAKSQVKAGDIVSVRTGYPGTSAVIPPEFQGANCIDILISTPGERINSEYLCDWINSSFGKGQVLRQQGGMAQQHFNVGEMRELLVALPDLDEQMKIRSKINAVASKLAIDRVFLEKLRTQKLGLMQDLLTGKVPIKVDAPEAAYA